MDLLAQYCPVLFRLTILCCRSFQHQRGRADLAWWNVASLQQPIPFLQFSEHSRCVQTPPPTLCSPLQLASPPPPREAVSICLASPAMTQHWWLQNTANALTHRRTLSPAGSLRGTRPCLCSQGFPFFFSSSWLSSMPNQNKKKAGYSSFVILPPLISRNSNLELLLC